MANPKKKGLGKGLGALIGGAPAATAIAPPPADVAPAPQLSDGSQLIELDPATIQPNPKQPRRHFDEEALQELAESIKRDGIQEPVIVRRVSDGYELVSGERRVRASVMADLERIPAVVRDISDAEMLKLGLIENIQREDLNAIELAEAYRDLMAEFGWTQEQVAVEVGKKRATVANTLRLLQLPPALQEHVAKGRLSMGHARALLAMNDPARQSALARKTIELGLSVRQVEQLASGQTKPPPKAAAAPDANIRQIEDELRKRLGTKVHLKIGKQGRGRIEIEYYSLDELDRLLALLRGGH